MKTIKTYTISVLAAVTVASLFANGVTQSKSEDIAKKIPQETKEQYEKRM